MGQPIRLEKMTSVRRQGWLAQRGQASEASTGPFLFNMSDNEDYEDPLESNKPGSSEAPTGLKAPARSETPAEPEIPPGPPHAPFLPVPQDLGANCYSQQDLNRIIQTFFYASKGRFEKKLKVKTLNVYYGRFYMECYNFCQ